MIVFFRSAQTGPMMNDPNNIPGGLGGVLAAGGAMVVSAVLWLRRHLSRESVDRSADVAYRLLIESQSARIESQSAQLDLERKRNKELLESQDAFITQISALRQQVAHLSDQVATLQHEIESRGKP